MSTLTQFFTGDTVKTAIGISVTGGILGLTYFKTGTNEITVNKGACKDSTGLFDLLLANASPVAIPNTPNQLNHLFLCDDGTVKVDTDKDGATLLSGTVKNLRWIGPVKNQGSGEVVNHSLNPENYLAYGSLDLGSAGRISLDPYCPDERIMEVYITGNYGTSNTNPGNSISGEKVQSGAHYAASFPLIWFPNSNFNSSSNNKRLHYLRIIR